MSWSRKWPLTFYFRSLNPFSFFCSFYTSMNDCTEFGLEPVHDDKTPGILRYFRPDIKMIISFFIKPSTGPASLIFSVWFWTHWTNLHLVATSTALRMETSPPSPLSKSVCDWIMSDTSPLSLLLITAAHLRLLFTLCSHPPSPSISPSVSSCLMF